MSRSQIIRNRNRISSIPGSKYTQPSGSSSLATSDHPEVLAYAILYGNRATRRLAIQKVNRSSHRKLMKSIGGDL